jgi:curved DNA-binding protein CbpA
MIDPYGVLGVTGDADFEALRAAYRRLVRENHPDVAPDKHLANTRMAQINEAWLLVGAPEKRASFDALLRLQAQENAVKLAAEERARIEAQRRARAEHEKRSRAASGNHRTSNKRATTSRVKKTSAVVREKKSDVLKRGARAQNPAREVRLVRKMAHASQLFHREGRAEESAALCREVLLADGRNVQARELLGDILAYQGRIESALLMLDQAVQISPKDGMLRRKRDSLQRRQQAASNAKNAAAKKKKRVSLLGRLRARLCKSRK